MVAPGPLLQMVVPQFAWRHPLRTRVKGQSALGQIVVRLRANSRIFAQADIAGSIGVTRSITNPCIPRSFAASEYCWTNRYFPEITPNQHLMFHASSTKLGIVNVFTDRKWAQPGRIGRGVIPKACRIGRQLTVGAVPTPAPDECSLAVPTAPVLPEWTRQCAPQQLTFHENCVSKIEARAYPLRRRAITHTIVMPALVGDRVDRRNQLSR